MNSQDDVAMFVQRIQHQEKMSALASSNKYYKEISESLKADVALAKRQAEDAKKDALFSKIFSVISLIVAIASATTSFLPYLG